MTIYIEQAKVQRRIKSNGVKVEVLEVVDSTNQYLKAIDTHYKNHVCIAEYQTRGKGRLQRNWHSPYAKNILLSMTHHFKEDQSKLGGLSMIVALSILKGLLGLKLPPGFKVKWPNDVYFKDQKISGILIESIAKNNQECSVIIGIGLNVNLKDSPQSKLTNWTSLKKITTKDFDRNKLCALLINNLIIYLNEFEIKGFKPFIPQWNKYDYLVGKNISVKGHSNVMDGLYKGIDETGNLLLQTEKRKVIAISSGDASIIKE